MPTATPDESGNTNKTNRSRLDRELEEILASSRADELPEDAGRKQPIQLPYHASSKQRQWAGLLAPQRRGALFIVIALLLAMLAVIVSDVSPLLANLLVIGAVVAFAYPIVNRVRASGSSSSMPTPSRTWRGREMDVTPPQTTPIDALRDWWNRRQRR